MGFLELRGTERLFALDGQHRVAGIRNALKAGTQIGDDILTVLFVPHLNDETGVARTRRLFVDLNKRAVPVARKDIIILDEVDLAAILSRRLVDEHPWFSRGQIDVDRFNNTIPKNAQALCSIGTLYDVIRRILPKALACTKDERDELKHAASLRLPEERIDYYYRRSLEYFEGLARANGHLRDYLESGPTSGFAVMARGSEERNVLFRPVGQAGACQCYRGSCRTGRVGIRAGNDRTVPSGLSRASLRSCDLGYSTTGDERKRHESGKPTLEVHVRSRQRERFKQATSGISAIVR